MGLCGTREPIRKTRQALDELAYLILANKRTVTGSGATHADITSDRHHPTQRIIIAPAAKRVGAITFGELLKRGVILRLVARFLVLGFGTTPSLLQPVQRRTSKVSPSVHIQLRTGL